MPDPKSVILRGVWEQGHMVLLPGVPVAFDDPDAVPFFKALGFAEDSDLPPVYVYSQAQVDIDPRTTIGGLEDARHGKPVLENPIKSAADYAAAAQRNGG